MEYRKCLVKSDKEVINMVYLKYTSKYVCFMLHVCDNLADFHTSCFLFKSFSSFPYLSRRAEMSARAEISPMLYHHKISSTNTTSRHHEFENFCSFSSNSTNSIQIVPIASYTIVIYPTRYITISLRLIQRFQICKIPNGETDTLNIAPCDITSKFSLPGCSNAMCI